MKKAVVKIGYAQYVMDTDKAIRLMELLEDTELYDENWVKNNDDKGYTSYHIYEPDTRDLIREIKLIPMEFYRVAKLAGRPVKA